MYQRKDLLSIKSKSRKYKCLSSSVTKPGPKGYSLLLPKWQSQLLNQPDQKLKSDCNPD